MTPPLRTFPLGEYSENLPWEIEENVCFSLRFKTPCAHALVSVQDGLITVPRIIRAYNEAGFNQTQLCADCLLGALR